MNRPALAAALVVLGTATTGCAAAGNANDLLPPRSGAPIPATVLPADQGGTVVPGACLLVRPPARWILRAPDVDPAPEQPGYIDFRYPPGFQPDPACASPTAVRVPQNAEPGLHRVILTQDRSTITVPVTLSSS